MPPSAKLKRATYMQGIIKLVVMCLKRVHYIHRKLLRPRRFKGQR